MNSIYEVADLIRIMGKVEGRKRLQKIVYILQQLDFPFEESFEYGFYGPYSRELSSELDDLSRNGILNETTDVTEVGDRFVYSPTDDLIHLFERHPEFSNLRDDLLEPVLAIITKSNTPTLEIASSLLFLARSGYSGQHLIDEVKTWKPKLVDFIPKAQDLLTSLNLQIA